MKKTSNPALTKLIKEKLIAERLIIVKMYNLPKYIELKTGERYAITNNGDYRVIMDLISVINDSDLTEKERSITAFIIFYEDFNCIEDVALFDKSKLSDLAYAMVEFIEANNSGKKSNIKLIDWEQDETLVCSAINNVAQTEIRSLPYLHWWTFIGYYLAIGECPLATVVSIRYKIAHNKKLDKMEQDFKRSNPEYFIWKKQAESEKKLIDSIWNQGGE